MVELTGITHAIAAFIEANNPCTEHDIITKLKTDQISPFDQLNLQQSKDLFCAHFLTMHALYQLQNSYFIKQQYHLNIQSIKIERRPYLTKEANDAIALHDPLKDYYLDIRHYFETSEHTVNVLLNSFWKKYLAQDDKQQVISWSLDMSAFAQFKKDFPAYLDADDFELS